MKINGDFVSQILADNHTIQKNEQAIYAYLFDYVIENVIYFFNLILIGLFCKKLDVALCYIFVTTPLRQFTGGYHASSRSLCTILSYGIFLSVLLCVPFMAYKLRSTLFLMYILGWITILRIAPVETKHKKFNASQKHNLHNKCVHTCIIITLLYIFLWHINAFLGCATISVCVILDVVGLFIGIIKNRRES